MSNYRLNSIDGFSKFTANLDVHGRANLRKIYVSDLEAAPCYVLALYAKGTYKVYSADLLFDCEKRLIGVYFKGGSLWVAGSQPRESELPDFSDNWKPDWENVHTPFGDAPVPQGQE